ncbi:Protein pbn1 [Lachnellula hyalina]|uniref:Protein PBN1 n=1 Tax=Lachnellula hyalina TaxID=1316788 RepID=A0A8H8QUK1_9HELO|nr:Protein pbn1 [Lachnellula hyalina]TVY23068.1 Protein pbn1 [Lachnellula hyalina]
MRQRITFIQQPQDSVDPNSLKVTKNDISTTGLKAAREDRVTFGFEELPQELYKVLKATHELHIRWVSESPYESIVPFVSRVSPGLHVFYTPQRNSNNSSLLCPALNKVFGEIDCISPEKSFTTLPIERFSHSSATQYYTPLPHLNTFIHYLINKLCTPQNENLACLLRVELIQSASYLDIDFDTISHALSITAFWPQQTWSSLSLPNTPSNRLEVGILSIQAPQAPEELSLGGFLTVVGEDASPSPTLFSFPARHHPTSQSFTSSFLLPSGLHPTLQLRISGSEKPVDGAACALHAHLTLPKTVFADKYQFDDALFLASKNLSAMHYISPGVDLEAPAYTVPLWGSSLLLELSPPVAEDVEWTAEVPLHLRYLAPSEGGVQETHIPAPVLFWACTAEEGSKFTVNPFERVDLGYEGLFGPRTMFHHLDPESEPQASTVPAGGKDVHGSGNGGRLVNILQVPVLDFQKTAYVEFGTATVVLAGFAWVCWCLWRVWSAGGYRRTRERAAVVVGGGEKKMQ